MKENEKEIKVGSFEKSIKINKSLAMFLIRNKRENMWIPNERGSITTDSKDAKNIIRE